MTYFPERREGPGGGGGGGAASGDPPPSPGRGGAPPPLVIHFSPPLAVSLPRGTIRRWRAPLPSGVGGGDPLPRGGGGGGLQRQHRRHLKGKGGGARGCAGSWAWPTLPASPLPPPPPLARASPRLRRSSAGHPGAARWPTTLGDVAFRAPLGCGRGVQPPPTGDRAASSPLPPPPPNRWKGQAPDERRAYAGGRRLCDSAPKRGVSTTGALSTAVEGCPTRRRGGGGRAEGDTSVPRAAGEEGCSPSPRCAAVRGG